MNSGSCIVSASESLKSVDSQWSLKDNLTCWSHPSYLSAGPTSITGNGSGDMSAMRPAIRRIIRHESTCVADYSDSDVCVYCRSISSIQARVDDPDNLSAPIKIHQKINVPEISYLISADNDTSPVTSRSRGKIFFYSKNAWYLKKVY